MGAHACVCVHICMSTRVCVFVCAHRYVYDNVYVHACICVSSVSMYVYLAYWICIIEDRRTANIFKRQQYTLCYEHWVCIVECENALHQKKLHNL